MITNKGKDLEKLSRKRRERFLAAIKQQPACIIDENSPDWLPTLTLGHSNIDVQLSEDFGEQYHMASSEPYFYSESYAPIKHKNAIPVNDKGRCVVAEEVGKRK